MTRTAENEITAITLDRSVVEQVLEALEEADLLMEHRQNVELRRSALVTLRAALEQPKQNECICNQGQVCGVCDPIFQPQGEQEPKVWLDGATHYQPQQKAFYKRVSADEWYVWDRVLQEEPPDWRRSLGTSDSAYWVLRHPQSPRQPLTDEQIEKICPSFDDPMRSEMWKIGFKAAHKIKDNT